MRLSDLTASTTDAIRQARAMLGDLTTPTIRLGVTGLSRAGKTVFITALVRNLTVSGRLPFLAAAAEGRIVAANLQPQPDDAVPRFDYETHVERLTATPPEWPDSTRHISELRVTIDYTTANSLLATLGTQRLHVDIVDYPGEWMLDLALLSRSYGQWAAQAITQARAPERAAAAAPFLSRLEGLDPFGPKDEAKARDLAATFTDYLHAARNSQTGATSGLATIGLGRFLMPGDLAGSPLLTFAPLPIDPQAVLVRGSLAAMMARRYESYKTHVVTPFFREHFSRLDRQIVLVDALAALDGGPKAIEDLTQALESALAAFKPGHASWLGRLAGFNRIDKILFAATKADHLPSASHDRLEAALRVITEDASKRAAFAGAEVSVLAIAALRATREAEVKSAGETLSVIRGTPLPGETIAGQTFDGKTETAIFPGDLPADPRSALSAGATVRDPLRVVRFRPPRIESVTAAPPPWPHVRLDRAIEFLIGDRLA